MALARSAQQRKLSRCPLLAKWLTPVNELGIWLKTESGQLPVALGLVAACDARAVEIERKRGSDSYR